MGQKNVSPEIYFGNIFCENYLGFKIFGYSEQLYRNVRLKCCSFSIKGGTLSIIGAISWMPMAVKLAIQTFGYKLMN